MPDYYIEEARKTNKKATTRNADDHFKTPLFLLKKVKIAGITHQ